MTTPVHALELQGASTGPHQPVDLVVEAGDVVIVTGPEDAGKTALLHAALGLTTLKKGRSLLFGVDVAKDEYTAVLAARAKAALASPDAPLLANLTLRDNLIVPLAMRSVAEAEAADVVDALLDELSLLAFAMKRPHELSNRVHREGLVARALLQPAKLYLLDEPPPSPPLAGRLKLRVDEGAAVVVATGMPARYESLRTVVLEPVRAQD